MFTMLHGFISLRGNTHVDKTQHGFGYRIYVEHSTSYHGHGLKTYKTRKHKDNKEKEKKNYLQLLGLRYFDFFCSHLCTPGWNLDRASLPLKQIRAHHSPRIGPGMLVFASPPPHLVRTEFLFNYHLLSLSINLKATCALSTLSLPIFEKWGVSKNILKNIQNIFYSKKAWDPDFFLSSRILCGICFPN